MDGARRRSDGPRASAAAEHHPLGQVDRDRSEIDRRRGGAHAGSRDRALQADQQRPIPERLPGIHLPLHAGRRDPLDRLALGVPYQDQSNIGRWRRRTVSGAAATPGSSRTRRSSGAIETGRIPRPSRHNCPNSACASTASRESRSRWIRSRDSAARRSPARGWGSTSWAPEIDETYLREATERTEACVKPVPALPQRAARMRKAELRPRVRVERLGKIRRSG